MLLKNWFFVLIHFTACHMYAGADPVIALHFNLEQSSIQHFQVIFILLHPYTHTKHALENWPLIMDYDINLGSEVPHNYIPVSAFQSEHSYFFIFFGETRVLGQVLTHTWIFQRACVSWFLIHSVIWYKRHNLAVQLSLVPTPDLLIINWVTFSTHKATPKPVTSHSFWKHCLSLIITLLGRLYSLFINKFCINPPFRTWPEYFCILMCSYIFTIFTRNSISQFLFLKYTSLKLHKLCANFHNYIN